MTYISREQLIEAVLNEDLGLVSSNGPRKRASVIVDTNEIEGDSKKKHSKGGQSRKAIDASTDMFRKPKNSEIKNIVRTLGHNPTSDDQTNQIRAFSKLLSDFDLLDKHYGSKETDWNEGKTNHRQVANSITNIKRELIKRYKKNMDTPIEDLSDVIQNSREALEQEIGVNVPEVIGAFKNWRDILVYNSKVKTAKFPKGFNMQLMANVEKAATTNYEEAYINLNRYLLDKTTSFKSPEALAKWINANQTLYAILNDPTAKRSFDAAMTSPNVKTIEEFMMFMVKDLEGKSIKPNRGNTMAYINNVARKRIQYFDLMMKRKGYKDGIASWPDVIDFLEEYKPFVYERILRNYDVTGDQLRSFGSGLAFCDYLFSDPERLWKILKPLQGNEGGKGVEMSVMHRDLEKKEKRLKSKIEGNATSAKRGPQASTIDELKEKIANRERMCEELAAELREIAKRNGLRTKDDRLNDPEYSKVYKVKNKAGKEAAAYRLTLKKRLDAIAKNGGEEPRRKSLEDEYAEIRDEREALEDKAYNRLKDDNAMDLFQQQYNRQKTRDAAGDFDIGTGYVMMGWSFKFDSEKHYEVAEFIENYIDKKLNGEELKNKKEDLINVTTEPDRYEGKMHTYPCTRVIIEYPKGSHLYNRVTSIKDKSQRSVIITEIIMDTINKVKAKYGVTLDVVDGRQDPRHRIKILSKNDAVGYSFR